MNKSLVGLLVLSLVTLTTLVQAQEKRDERAELENIMAQVHFLAGSYHSDFTENLFTDEVCGRGKDFAEALAYLMLKPLSEDESLAFQSLELKPELVSESKITKIRALYRRMHDGMLHTKGGHSDTPQYQKGFAVKFQFIEEREENPARACYVPKSLADTLVIGEQEDGCGESGATPSEALKDISSPLPSLVTLRIDPLIISTGVNYSIGFRACRARPMSP